MTVPTGFKVLTQHFRRGVWLTIRLDCKYSHWLYRAFILRDGRYPHPLLGAVLLVWGLEREVMTSPDLDTRVFGVGAQQVDSPTVSYLSSLSPIGSLPGFLLKKAKREKYSKV